LNGKQETPRIAIDAMGGDHAPEEIVAGAVLAHRDGLGRMILVGDESRLAPLLAQHQATELEVVHAPSAIAMDANPSQAVRGSDDTSLGVAIALLRDGLADAVVSAGNSGAFLAIALIRLRTIPGIARPAIAVVFPGKKGPVILLDAGANVDCKPEWLAQFGLMGAAYAKAGITSRANSSTVCGGAMSANMIVNIVMPHATRSRNCLITSSGVPLTAVNENGLRPLAISHF